MPAETLRGRSAVGRFPSVTFGSWDSAEDNKEEPEEDSAETGNACLRWLRKVSSCCHRQNEDDITDALVPETDDHDKEEEEHGEGPATDEDELEELLLRVKSIDLMKSQSGANRTAHHTNLYQSDDCVIRRGQTFHMWVTLCRPFDPSTDKLHLVLKTGPQPAVSRGTHITMPLVEVATDPLWEAAVVKQDGNRINLSVKSPSTAAIGRYQLTVETNCASGRVVSAHDPANDVYVLFNPWCKDDAVFMDSDDQRQEYVLNEIGLIYYGTENQIGQRTWNYGQFDDGILAVCLFLLEKSGTSPSGWGDPVNVVRVVSAMINSRDDSGVVEGNWSGSYSSGTSPTVWSGSVEILKEYYKSSGAPVKYGQCWVFAGVFTTVLRCLGIPSRTVTNFSSAHDTDVSLTTDIYLDENMDPIHYLNTDSVWNFHVWNDCWMSRPDLPEGYGGWQTVDATPQETSQGTFRCGPASLTAVRNGHVFLKHDSPFVFAEVNSDKIYWQKNADQTFTQIYSEKKTVGHCISTKAVGSEERDDITLLYKYPEAEDVSIDVTMDGEGPTMGQDAELTITLRNSSSEQRTVALHSQVAVMYYTGVYRATVGQDRMDVDILPNEVKVLEWILGYSSYREQLVDQAALLLTLSGRVRETQQVLATQYSFRLRTPDLVIKLMGKAVVGEKTAAQITFTNPLPQVLEAVTFHVEGLGLLSARKFTYGDIGSLASVSVTEHFVPSLSGPRKLLASLDCDQLTQVHGAADIIVEERSIVAV